MENVLFWRFMASVLQTYLLIPTVLVLIPWWRFSTRGMLVRAAALEGVVTGFSLLLYVTLGAASLSTWLAGTLPPLLCLWAFWYCCSLRDSRFLFLMATIGLDTSLCDALASILFSRSCPWWLVARIVLGGAQVLLLRLLCRDRLLEMLDGNQINWKQTSMIPLSLWICAIGYYYIPVVQQDGRTVPLPTLLLVSASVLIYVTLYRFQQATLEQAEARQYGALLRSEVSYLEREAKQAEAVEQNARIVRHDLRHYARLLQGCLDTGDLNSAREIVDLLEQNADSLSVAGGLTAYTGRPLLDTVLTQAEEGARITQSRFDVRLVLPEALPVEEPELAVVISNALENAFRAVSKEAPGAPRAVAVSGKSCGSQLLLEITNTFSGTVTPDETTGLPRSCAAGHGYGMQSIAGFARKYGGSLDCGVRDGLFSLRLLL